MTQVWIAMCAYLIMAFLTFRDGLEQGVSKLLRVVQLALFERRDLCKLFSPLDTGDRLEDFGQLVML